VLVLRPQLLDLRGHGRVVRFEQREAAAGADRIHHRARFSRTDGRWTRQLLRP
jgi:pyridoxine/pyridoxamine 5'-phosphate oxidase